MRITLTEQGPGTQLVLDHAGVPEDQQEHIDAGWHARYWRPLSAYLEAG